MFFLQDQRQHCYLCGIFTALEGCHVKDKTEFTPEEIHGGGDRNRNIIFLCKSHHKEFDNRRSVGLCKFSPGNWSFVRIGHCWKGVCAKESLQPLVNQTFLELGFDDCDVIHPDYINWKNLKLKNGGLREFATKPGQRRKWKKCEE